MKRVRIMHPDAGEATVPESAVPHWRSSGWEVAPEPVPAGDAGGEHATVHEQDSKPHASRRRTSKGDE